MKKTTKYLVLNCGLQNMIKIISFIILTLSFYYKGYSQFIVIQQNPTSDFYHTLLPQTTANQFKVFVHRITNNTVGNKRPHQILTYDFSGQFIDSVNFPSGFEPLNAPIEENNFYYWSCLYLDTLAGATNVQNAFILKFDSNFNCIQRIKITHSISNSFDVITNPIKINNRFYVSVKNQNTCKFYKFDNLFNKLDSAFFNGNLEAIELQKTHDDNILIAGYGFSPASIYGNAQKIVLDTTLQIKNVFNLDSLTYVTAGGSIITGCSSEIGVVSFSGGIKIIPVTPSKNYIIGRYDVIYNAQCNRRYNLVHSVIDNTNHIINTTLISDTTRDVMYADNTNFYDFKNDNIYTVGSAGYNGFFMQGNNSSILITKSDTLGNLIWKKSYGDDMFYRPVSIIRSLDGGFIISGIRYNYNNPMYSQVVEGFILKLDANGDNTANSIIENGEHVNVSVRSYPNPVKENVYFEVPFAENYQIEISDVLGRKIYSNTHHDNNQPILLNYLEAGVYVYMIKTNKNYFSGKFVKQ